MKSKIMFASVLAGLLATPLAANAQGIPDGIQHGASVGSQTAGPVGAMVGGAVGGVIGGVEGLFGWGPTYVAYPAPAPVVYPEHRSRYLHRHVHRSVEAPSALLVSDPKAAGRSHAAHPGVRAGADVKNTPQHLRFCELQEPRWVV